MTSTVEDDFATALHEAAHVVVALATRGKVEGARLGYEVVEGNAIDGRAETGPVRIVSVPAYVVRKGGLHVRTEDEVQAYAQRLSDRAELAVALAGRAVGELTGRRVPTGGLAHDDLHAAEVAVRLGGQPGVEAQRAYDRATRLLMSHIGAVRRIADALVERRELSGPELRRLYREPK